MNAAKQREILVKAQKVDSLSVTVPGRGGGVLPHLGNTGTCRWIGYGFLASLS